MPTMSDQEKQKWAAKVVAILYTDDNRRQKFMTAYHSKSPAIIKAFLMNDLAVPEELAAEISDGSGQDLSNYIGQLICDYLW